MCATIPNSPPFRAIQKVLWKGLTQGVGVLSEHRRRAPRQRASRLTGGILSFFSAGNGTLAPHIRGKHSATELLHQLKLKELDNHASCGARKPEGSGYSCRLLHPFCGAGRADREDRLTASLEPQPQALWPAQHGLPHRQLLCCATRLAQLTHID